MVDSYPIACAWAGGILSALVALALFADGAQILLARAGARAEFATTGFPESSGRALGIICLICAVLYAIPQTAVLGAILVTGFLGGAISTHLRLGRLVSPPQVISLILGVMAWGGLYLRNPHLRELLPFVA
jgi:DoxX-like family